MLLSGLTLLLLVDVCTRMTHIHTHNYIGTDKYLCTNPLNTQFQIVPLGTPLFMSIPKIMQYNQVSNNYHIDTNTHAHMYIHSHPHKSTPIHKHTTHIHTPTVQWSYRSFSQDSRTSARITQTWNSFVAVRPADELFLLPEMCWGVAPH